MADTFFGFNTSLTDDIGDHLPDEPGQILDEEEEEEYDALNDETFGSEAVADDWEEDHEKLVEITEQSRNTFSDHRNSNSSGAEQESTITRQGESADLDLEAQISQLVLEDYDSENGDKSSTLFSAAVNYSSSAPSCYSMWGVGKVDVLKPAALHAFDTQSVSYRLTHPVLPEGKKVCTVEELERDLLSKNSVSSVVNHPAIVHVEDVERELTAPSQGFVGTKPPQGQTCASIQSQDLLFPSCRTELITNGAPSSVRPAFFPQGGSLHVSVQPSSRPVLNRSSVMMSNVVSPPFIGGPPEIRHLQQQNQRLIGSAPNLVNFLVPRMFLQQQAPQQSQQTSSPQQQQQQKQQTPSIAGCKSQLFPADNSLLHNVYFKSGANSQGPGGDQQRVNRGMPPGHFHYRGSDWGPTFHTRNFHNQLRGYHGHGVPGALHSSYNGFGPGDDEYAGLMTPREKQWLMNIQHMQLNTNQPFVDDYYYKMFTAKEKRRNTANLNQQHDVEQKPIKKNISYVNEQHDTHSTEILNSSRGNTPAHLQQQEVSSSYQGCNKTYTPTQFENSLGKLQVGSVTAPRKVIDMDVVSPDTVDPPLQLSLKEARRSIQLLLTIEWMYGVLLQIEALASPIPELRETARGDKVELLEKLLNLLGSEADVFLNIMCVSKGKALINRLLTQMKLPEMESEVASIFCKIFCRLVTIVRRDGEHGILLKYLPVFEQFLNTARTSTFLMLTDAFISPDDRYYTSTGMGRNIMIFALSCKFGTAVISLLLKYSTTMNSCASLSGCEQWTRFIDNLVCTANLVPPSSSMERVPVGLTPELLDKILNSYSVPQDKGSALKRILLGETETITET